MIQLLGSNFDENTHIFTFFFYNTNTKLYSEMSCRNAFGVMDMHSSIPTITREEFIKISNNK